MSTTPTKSTAQVLKAIGCDKLALYAGKGYWFFAYYDKATGQYDTHSVMTMRLRDCPLEMWVVEGRELVAKMEKQK